MFRRLAGDIPVQLLSDDFPRTDPSANERGKNMKYAGLLVMPAGFFLTLAALALFPDPRGELAFVLCGLAVEAHGPGRCGARPHAAARGQPPMNAIPPMVPRRPALPRNERRRFCAHARAPAACAAGHRRRGAHQYRPWPLALGRAGAAGQPGPHRRRRHRLRFRRRILRRHAGTQRSRSARGGKDLERARARALSSSRPRRRRAAGATCAAVSSFWPSPWRLCFPGARAPIAGGSRPAAHPRPSSPRIVFPLAAHWIWDGGWLAALGANFSLGAGFLDAGGAATVHVLGGLSALAVVWIAGPRRGKFPKEGLSTAMPGHNATYVLFGCLLALVGWLAWNAAGAILWLHAPLAALPGTAINTLLSASGALAATFSVTRFRFGKPDASLCANGWLAGLVASSACAAVATPVDSLFVGGVAGIFTPLLVELLELALSIDDPSGAITVHGAAGLWGLIARRLLCAAAGAADRAARRHRRAARLRSAARLSALRAAQPLRSLPRRSRRRAHRHGPARARRRSLSGVRHSPRRILSLSGRPPRRQSHFEIQRRANSNITTNNASGTNARPA